MIRITFQDTLQTATSPQVGLGTKANTPDGSSWQYVKVSEAVTKGFIVSPVAVSGVDEVSSSTNSAGQIVYITKAGATLTTGEYANGWVVVDDGTGEGQVAKIRTNNATTLELYPEWALTTALSVADSDITLSKVNTLVEKVPITAKDTVCTGAAQVAFAANEYGWVLTKGPGIVIAGVVITANKNFTPGDDTEGQVIIGVTAEGPFNAFNLGYSLAANTTADKGFLALMGIATA